MEDNQQSEDLGNLGRLVDIVSDGIPEKPAEEIYGVFAEAAIILAAKHKRMGKPILKRSEISKALLLTHYLQTNNSTFYANRDDMNRFLGIGPLTEGQAIDYYQEELIGEVYDINKREIIIDERGLNFLYKSKDSQAHHDESMDPKNYQEYRGKRLPWIKPIIRNTKCILIRDREVFIEYFYTGRVLIPHPEGTHENHFLVVVKKNKGEPARFVTAYYTDKYRMFLRKVEPFEPFKPR
jgi:hypothetical protein